MKLCFYSKDSDYIVSFQHPRFYVSFPDAPRPLWQGTLSELKEKFTMLYLEMMEDGFIVL
jgi:hypothetical protein